MTLRDSVITRVCMGMRTNIKIVQNIVQNKGKNDNIDLPALCCVYNLCFYSVWRGFSILASLHALQERNTEKLKPTNNRKETPPNAIKTNNRTYKYFIILSPYFELFFTIVILPYKLL